MTPVALFIIFMVAHFAGYLPHVGWWWITSPLWILIPIALLADKL